MGAATAGVSTARLVGYWTVSIVAAVLYAGPGVALLAHSPHFTTELSRLGYPEYFPTILGLPKVAAAAVILAPGLRRLKEWAYAGMIFDAAGAAASRAAVSDAVWQVAFPLVLGGIVLASWALRPSARQLSGD